VVAKVENAEGRGNVQDILQPDSDGRL